MNLYEVHWNRTQGSRCVQEFSTGRVPSASDPGSQRMFKRHFSNSQEVDSSLGARQDRRFGPGPIDTGPEPKIVLFRAWPGLASAWLCPGRLQQAGRHLNQLLSARLVLDIGS